MASCAPNSPVTERLFLSLCFPDKETKVLKGLSQNSRGAESAPEPRSVCDSDGAAQSSCVASRNPINTHVPISRCLWQRWLPLA